MRGILRGALILTLGLLIIYLLAQAKNARTWQEVVFEPTPTRDPYATPTPPPPMPVCEYDMWEVHEPDGENEGFVLACQGDIFTGERWVVKLTLTPASESP